MTGIVAKSGRFYYYACNNSRRREKRVCQTPLKAKEKIERFVVERIKETILTRENLEEIVNLTNAEARETRLQDEE